MPLKYLRWLPKEIAWLKQEAPSLQLRAAVKAFSRAFPERNRTEGAIASAARRLRLRFTATTDRWTDEEIAWLKENFPRYPAKELVQLYCQAFRRSRSAVSLQKEAARFSLLMDPDAVRAAYQGRPGTQRRLAWDTIPRYTAFERLTGDFVVCSDIHVPKVDPEMLAYVVEVGKRYRIPNLLILGDFFDQDEFSHWSIAGLQPQNVKFEQELVYACQTLEDLLDGFEKVYVLRGNHDERILRLLRYALDLRSVFGLVEQRSAKALKALLEKRLLVSDYTFCHVNETWFCCHPSTYSKVPGAAAREIAETEGMSVIMGNGHLLSMTRDKSDRYWACESGCLVDPLKVYYKQMQVKRFPKWQQGFLVLRKNQPILLHREHLKAGAPWKETGCRV